MEKVKVAILLATYNGEKYIAQQINSLLLCVDKVKELCDVSILISDDASPDNTVSIVKGFCEDNDNIILIDDSRKGGVKLNFQFLIKNTPNDVDFIFFSDQDDFWLPNKLDAFITRFRQKDNNKPLLFHSDLTVVDENLFPLQTSMFNYQKLAKQNTLNELITQNNVTGCVMAINKSGLDIIKELDLADSIMHDWFIAIHIKFYGEIHFIDKPTILYRQHAGNQVGAKQLNISTLLGMLKNIILYLKKSRDSIDKTRLQAELFYNNAVIDNSNRPELVEIKSFIDSFQKNWVSRMLCFSLKGFKKHSVVRNIIFLFVYVFWNDKGKK